MKYLFVLLFFVSQLTYSEMQADIINDTLDKPWSVAQLPDKKFLITDKSGELFLFSADGADSQLVSGLPDISVVGQGGLLDVAIHPKFNQNQFIYLSYVAGNRSQGYGTEVIRAKLVDNKLIDSQVIFVALPKVRGGRHFGSRLLFDAQNNLFISLGDRGERDEAQKLDSHIGTIIRLHDDGSIPKDNPFVAVPSALPEIYSYGHRNVQGMALHPQTGKVWAHEHGPQGGDEVNIIEAGKNYGWPVSTYGKEYGTGFNIGSKKPVPGIVLPVHQWTPSIAPSGMAFFEDKLYVGALKFQLLSRLTLKGEAIVDEARFFEGELGRIRDVRVFDNSLYLLSEGRSASLIKIIKK